jgi:hypothetical protein
MGAGSRRWRKSNTVRLPHRGLVLLRHKFLNAIVLRVELRSMDIAAVF